MAVCKYCGRSFQPLGIMRHRVACREKYEKRIEQKRLEVDYSIRKKDSKVKK